MKTIKQFSAVATGYGNEPPVLELQTQGRKVSLQHRGATLDAQFETNDGRFVVFTSDADPSEARLYITLLSSELKDLEHITIGQDYADGILKNLTVESGGEIQFEFFNGVLHLLNFSVEPQFRFFGPGEVTHSKSIFQRKYITVKRSAIDGQ